VKPQISNINPNQHAFIKVDLQPRHPFKQHKDIPQSANIRPTFNPHKQRVIGELEMRHNYNILASYTVPRE
jgi:hypothetical protein